MSSEATRFETMDVKSVEYVLTTTRAVRRRFDFSRKVPRDVVRECLNLALQAPNGSNMNTWRWVIVDDPALIARIADLYRASMNDHVASLGESVGKNYRAADNPGFGALNESIEYFLANVHRLPMIAFPLVAGRTEGLDIFGQASAWGSVLQSVWSFMLALRTRGMGSTWTTVHLLREREFAELLGIPFEKYTQVGMFPVAYTVGVDFRPAWRKPVEEVLSWNRFEPAGRK